MTVKRKFFIIISILSLLILTFFLFHKKEFVITGFAYKGDKITIKQSEVYLTDLEMNCILSQEGLCSFYEKVQLTNLWDDKKFVIRVDSGKTILLDTLMTISNNIKKPIISFQDPNETGFKRVVFVNDESDERIIIP